MLVVDDGWFGVRMSTMSSVGDWTENRRKFPKGLLGLKEDLQHLSSKCCMWM